MRVLLLIPMLCACDTAPAEQGLYYWGAEVNVVCPCGTDACFWVRGEREILDPLKNYVQRQTSRPYQPVYIEYRGRPLDDQPIGFAANYDGYHSLLEIVSVSTTLPDHCPEP